MSSDSRSPEAPIYKLSAQVTPPQDPSEYRVTDHFRYRKKHRRNPTITSEIVRACFEEGQIKHTQVSNEFFFEIELDYRYRVVVALRDEAFLEDEQKHRALTVYAVDGDHDVDEGWQ